jgi:hypothetical protein
MNAEGQRALWNSIYTGLIGYLAVAVFFLVLDPLLGRGFLHTPALLGSALFYGLTDPAALTIQPGPIIAYNGAHVVVFLVLGLVVGELTYASVRLRQQMWYLVTMLVILVLGYLYVALWVLKQPVRSPTPGLDGHRLRPGGGGRHGGLPAGALPAAARRVGGAGRGTPKVMI